MNKENNYIKIFDTTLRDGEQSPGASMNIEEKLKIAEALEDLKVDIIEAGFPAASKGDYEAVSEISKKIKNSSICALSSGDTESKSSNVLINFIYLYILSIILFSFVVVS